MTSEANHAASLEQALENFHQRWRNGERLRVEQCLEKSPALAGNSDAILDLVYQEIILRETDGETPSLDEYQQRFPQLAKELALQFEVDRAIRSQALADRPTRRDDEAVPQGRANFPSIPGYELLTELGRGGMGIVYKARHLGLNRIVALKTLLSGAYAGVEEVERFKAEAQAVARLQHPNIVQVFDVGEYDGRPYFSLEFCPGGSLAARLRGQPLPPREAAQLCETLAGAVQVAHQAGIIHRDLKPANILLAPASGREFAEETRPEAGAKITDFGLAKRLDVDSGLTRTGIVVGTPSYMAPEQASGRIKDIGPHTDVWAIGAILYELLTGRPPFHAATATETLRQVLDDEPVPLSRLLPRCPRDLETICLKCLLKAPPRRYASAADLADDLHRYLQGEPIKARRPSLLERVWKWAKRRPARAALVVVSVTAVAIVAGGGWLAYSQVEQKRLEAEDNFREALAAVEEMLTEAGDMDLAEVPQVEAARKRLLLKAVQFYERFLARRGGDPAVRREMARARSRLGDIRELLGERPEAEQAYLDAIALWEALPADKDQQRELARACTNQGILLKKLNRFAEAEQAFDRALNLRASLVQTEGDPTEYRQELAASRYHLGTVLARQSGKQAAAEQAYRDALDLQGQLASTFPKEPSYRRDLARTLGNLGILLKTSGRGDWEDPLRQALRLQRDLVAGSPSSVGYRRELARSVSNLGTLLRDNRQTAAAEEAYREAVDLLARLSAEFPTVPDYRQELAAVHANLGLLLQTDPKLLAEAETAFREALALRRKLTGLPDYRHREADTLLKLGFVLSRGGKAPEAEEAYRDALRLTGALIEAHPAVGMYQNAHGAALNHLARWLQDRDDPAAWRQARECLEAAMSHNNKAHQGDPGNTLYRQSLRNDHFLLASVLLRLKDHQAAAEVAEGLPKINPTQAEDYVVAAEFVARCLPLTAEKERADGYARRAVNLLRDAMNRGFRGVRELKELPVYEPLRRRDDFRQLIEDLEQKTTTGVG